jgi:tetratricopeptide (TPR) repeat protein
MLLLPVLAACGGSAPPPPEAQEPIPETIEVPDPDLSRMEPPVRALLERTRAELLEAEDQASAWGALANAYHAHNLHDLAEVCYRRAAQLDPEDFRWTYLLAVVRQAGGARPDELRALFDEAALLRPDYAPLFIRSGLAFAKHGDYDAARDALTRAIDLQPASAVAHRGLGQVLLAQGDAAGALRHLEQARTAAPDDGAIYALLAQAESRLGRDDRARAAADRSSTLPKRTGFKDPVLHSEVDALSVGTVYNSARAMALLRKGEVEKAIEELTRIAEVKPNDFDVHLALWMTHTRARHPDRAMTHLSRAVTLKPEMPGPRIALARMLEEREDAAAAAFHYAAAAEAAPEDVRVQLEAGTALGRLGQYEPALLSLQAVVQLDPSSADAHFRLGEVLEALGRADDARKHYDEAVRIDPGHQAAQKLGDTRR